MMATGNKYALGAALLLFASVFGTNQAFAQAAPGFVAPTAAFGVSAQIPAAVELELGTQDDAKFNEARVKSNLGFSLLASIPGGRSQLTLVSHDSGTPLFIVPLRGYEDLLPEAASLEALYNFYRFTAVQQ